VDQEGFVFIFAKNVIEEGVTRALLLVEHSPLAHARVDQETESKGQIALACKIFDGLRARVFLKREVGLIQIGDDFSVFIANGGVDGDEFYFCGDFGLRLGWRLLLRL
jgi:hypothetical protein